MQRAKETTADVAASAKSGMEKTKATLGEKAEKMTTRDPMKKDMAERKKDERLYEAEREKQEARDAARRGHTHPTTGYSAEGPVGAEYPAGTTKGAVGSQYPAGAQGKTGVLDTGDRDLDEKLEREKGDRPAGVGGGGGRTAGTTY